MFCSTVIPTISRPTLSRAVCSVLDQEFTADDFEVIVVNDSGQPLPEEEWQKSERVRVIHTNRRRWFARNAGASIAKGQYLHFLDDDDWLLPGALEQFWHLAQRAKDAVWLYGGYEVINKNGERLGGVNSGLNGNCFAQVMGGESILLQASLIKASAFYTIGGFDQSNPAGPDIDLWLRMALYGDFANMPVAVAALFRDLVWGTTTDYDRVPRYIRGRRNIILGEPGAFARLQASANSSYWHGRIIHNYVSAVLLNLRYKRLFTATSRALFGLAGFILAGIHIFSPRFWQGVKDSKSPNSVHFIMKAYEDAVRQQQNGKE